MPIQSALPIVHLSPSDLIFISDANELVTDSLTVSKHFSKQHKHVLSKIESLDCSEVFTSANFSAYVQKLNIGNSAVRESKVYQMTKDGFMFLVMGFTGKRAAAVKEAYINAFNQMAEQLTKKPAAEPLSYRIMTVIENGQAIESKMIPNDAFIISKSRIAQLFNEPNLFNVDELLAISSSVNASIAEIAKLQDIRFKQMKKQ
ncbi:Rha family transcriptional regulator [Photobacterium phosphoreum]|uniref:Rha family transcriptional regulator n=1 Tax=Photobacterium phosphoreum TaxID=659 RepID=UPI000D16798C|nr:Rha family transcriptional regulator [Photobacterium phosphoreum]PSU71336.1 Rha family transcriptional regulator [Photobacterium phosphoreum]PSW08074.1 Rha family transcriptional regulator [Photobacterium phosphoreum]